MTTVAASYNAKCEFVETRTLAEDLATDPVFTHTLNHSGTMNASSAVVVSECWSDTVALSSGTATIDLTALTRGNGGATAVNMSGLKVQIFKFENVSTNTAAITITDGASNGYNIFGDASGQVTLGIGCVLQVVCPTAEYLPDVAAGAKDIDLSSSDQDATINVMLAAG